MAHLEVLDGPLESAGGEEGGGVAVLVLGDVVVPDQVVQGARFGPGVNGQAIYAYLAA